MARKCFLERVPDDFVYTLWVKNFVKIVLFRTVSEINVFLRFKQKFEMVAKNGKKIILGKKCQMSPNTLAAKKFNEIILSYTASEMNASEFYVKIQDGHQK